VRADDLVSDLLTDDYVVVIMCSSLGREYSLEGPEVGHGLFTLGLVEALNGRPTSTAIASSLCTNWIFTPVFVCGNSARVS
jgi:hypothetical protein